MKRKLKVMLRSHKNGKYIYIKEGYKEYNSDKEIIQFLGIDEPTYQELLLNNGEFKVNNEIYFKTDEDAIFAVEWMMERMDSFLILKELS